MLSPRPADLHRDAFAIDSQAEKTVDLVTHRCESDPDDLELDDDREQPTMTTAAARHRADNVQKRERAVPRRRPPLGPRRRVGRELRRLGTAIGQAILGYNHSQAYVNDVLARAHAY